MVPRENHQKNIRSLIEKSEFVPQMTAIIVYARIGRCCSVVM